LKSSKLIYYIIAGIVLVLVILIAKESFLQPGMKRFEGKYQELGAYRNENNTGPVVRIYAVKAIDQSTSWMQEYGDAMPHTKYGKTIVFFFNDQIDQEISLSPTEPYFGQELQRHVIATYQKSPMGDVSFIEGYPK